MWALDSRQICSFQCQSKQCCRLFFCFSCKADSCMALLFQTGTVLLKRTPLQLEKYPRQYSFLPKADNWLDKDLFLLIGHLFQSEYFPNLTFINDLCQLRLLLQDTIDWVAQTTALYFLTLLEAGVQDEGAGLLRFWWGFSPWACRRLSSHCVLTRQGGWALVSLPLLIRTLIASWGPHPHDPEYI